MQQYSGFTKRLITANASKGMLQAPAAERQDCAVLTIFMLVRLEIINQLLKNYVQIDFTIDDYKFLTESLQFLIIYICVNIVFAVSFLAK